MDLEQILSDHYGPSVQIKELVTLKGDASSRRYHRLHLNGATPDESMPGESIVVMELPEDAFGSDEATAAQAEGELPFVNMTRHLDSRGIRVPRLLMDATNDGVLLLEDLGDATLERVVAGAGAEVVGGWYDTAVDLLAHMHRRMWPIPTDCVAAGREFDFELLRWELDHYREWGAEARAGAPLAADLRGALDPLFDELAKTVCQLPRGFVHRDYQSRNLMVLADEPSMEALAVIDFQDALAGPRVYDLVALLNDSYVELPPAEQERLISRYAAAMDLDRAELTREFHLVTVQRKLKDGGRFVFIDQVKHNPSFLPFVTPSFARVRRSLAQLEELKPLADLLKIIDPENFG